MTVGSVALTLHDVMTRALGALIAATIALAAIGVGGESPAAARKTRTHVYWCSIPSNEGRIFILNPHNKRAPIDVKNFDVAGVLHSTVDASPIVPRGTRVFAFDFTVIRTTKIRSTRTLIVSGFQGSDVEGHQFRCAP